MKKIFYIMGKSATGKDHIYRALAEDPELDLSRLVLYTTRPRRENEENGREYFFTDEKTLDDLRRRGKIIEERCYQTVNGPWYYFTADDGDYTIPVSSLVQISLVRESTRKEPVCGQKA